MEVGGHHFWHRLDPFYFVGLIFVAKQKASSSVLLVLEVVLLLLGEVVGEQLGWLVGSLGLKVHFVFD